MPYIIKIQTKQTPRNRVAENKRRGKILGKTHKNTFKALILSAVFFMVFSMVAGGNTFAGELNTKSKKGGAPHKAIESVNSNELIEPPKGEAPYVDAIEIEQGALLFKDAGEEPEMLRPNHPPIDEIPPMPMPQDTTVRSTSSVTGSGIIYNPETSETIVTPNDDSSFLEDPTGFVELVKGGGYAGVDGSQGIEEVPMTFYDMYQITNTGSHPPYVRIVVA